MARDALPRGWSIELFQVDRDLDGVMAVDEASFVNPWTRDMFLWEAHHSDVSRLFVCRDAAGTVVAYCATWVVFDELHINNLAVLPAWRRRGVAAALLSEVLASNAAAIALYTAFGFVLRGRRPRYYAKPEEDALILWRETGPGSVETPRDE
jgi:ribosomal-protein-alanine N-acetyltransferase